MAQLLVRNLDDAVRDRLRRRAASKGRSMEEEVREILAAAVASDPPVEEPLGTWISRRFAGIGLREGEEIPELRGWTVQVPDFEE
jgi:plasmid stability protein